MKVVEWQKLNIVQGERVKRCFPIQPFTLILSQMARGLQIPSYPESPLPSPEVMKKAVLADLTCQLPDLLAKHDYI